MCTTYQGVPFGPAIIVYNDSKDKGLSFKAVSIFNEGKLNMSPFLSLEGDGAKRLFTMMINGRNADGFPGAIFHPK